MKRAVIGMGTNIGNREENLRGAVEALERIPGLEVERVSKLFDTDPVGYLDQPSFLNGVVLVRTELSPQALLGCCLGIEAGFKRNRTIKDGPRILDLDLLLYEGVQCTTKELILPHPRMWERAFVLFPLADLFPGKEVFGINFSDYFTALCPETVRIYVPFAES